jgi:hypothetical protein
MSGNPQPDDRNAGTFAALMGLAFVALFLLGLTALVIPQALGVVLVVGFFAGAVGFHYFVWGRWLTRVLRDAEAERQSAAAQIPPKDV